MILSYNKSRSNLSQGRSNWFLNGNRTPHTEGRIKSGSSDTECHTMSKPEFTLLSQVSDAFTLLLYVAILEVKCGSPAQPSTLHTQSL